ncbi:MAG: flavodoxin family protein [Nitrososphaeria archaeon]
MVLNNVLGVVGSPRKGRLTDQLVSKCLEGVSSIGTKTRKVYLIDYNVPFYTEQAVCPDELNSLCEEADAIVIGSPVYWGGINGLTKNFMDTVRISNANGKYGLGISVAGGTGKGVCSALQDIYRFFYHRRMRGLYPTPVTRFNFDSAMKSLYDSGQKLAKLPVKKKVFLDYFGRAEYYEKLRYLNYTYIDEFVLLTKYLLKSVKRHEKYKESKKEYELALKLIGNGEKGKALKHVVKAYNALYFPPKEE